MTLWVHPSTFGSSKLLININLLIFIRSNRAKTAPMNVNEPKKRHKPPRTSKKYFLMYLMPWKRFIGFIWFIKRFFIAKAPETARQSHLVAGYHPQPRLWQRSEQKQRASFQFESVRLARTAPSVTQCGPAPPRAGP